MHLQQLKTSKHNIFKEVHKRRPDLKFLKVIVLGTSKKYEMEVLEMAEQAAKKTFKVPHTFVILFFLSEATIGTYIIPAGVYDRVTDLL